LALSLQDAYKVRPEDPIQYIANHLLNQNQSHINLGDLNSQFKKHKELIVEQEKINETIKIKEDIANEAA